MTEVSRVINELGRFTDRTIRELAPELILGLVDATPFLTGWAQSGWVASVGAPFIEDRQSRSNPAQTQAAKARQLTSIALISDYTVSSGKLFITNNTPYLLRLNDGSSVQAPPMFIEDTIDRVVNRFNERSVF